MSRINRRHFLQFSSSLLATLGLKQLDFFKQANQYNQVLAQGTNGRKLALLVGINNYPAPIDPLRGCLNDISMQRELLIYRYGFNPNDILMVKDQQATRESILTAFEEHLIKQAKPNDTVVFCYSGHGSYVLDPDPISDPQLKGLNGTICPYDSSDAPRGEANDIMGKTLFLLASALKTENFTYVLDSCHSGGGLRGNAVVKSIQKGRWSRNDAYNPTRAEIEYQQRWREKLGLSAEELKRRRSNGIAKGIAIGAAQNDQYATDAPFNGFSAGAFSYLLTRYLWQLPQGNSMEILMNDLQLRTRDLAAASSIIQDPYYEVKPNSNYDKKPIYFLIPQTPSAEAVIRKVNGNEVEFWLGGVSSNTLETYDEGTLFSFIDNQGKSLGKIEQTSRDGLIAKGIVKEGKPSEGTLMREEIRGIPNDLTLRIGIDSGLSQENKALAEKELSSIPRVEIVPLGESQTVDYIFGKMKQESVAMAKTRNLSDIGKRGTLGLFNSTEIPISDSFSNDTNESVTEAIERLRPKLKMLLAGRILETAFNSETSKLSVDVKVDSDKTGTKQRSSSRGLEDEGTVFNSIETQTVRDGETLTITVTNHERVNLYLSVLVIADTGEIKLLYPLDWNAPADAANIPAKESITVPEKEDDFNLTVRGNGGFFELLVLTSTTPLRNTLKAFQSIAKSRGKTSRSPLDVRGDEADIVVDNLLGDFNNAKRSGLYAESKSRSAVDSETIAVFSGIMLVESID